MPFRSVADADEVAMLTEVLNAYCKEHRIAPGTPEHQLAAQRVLFYFSTGVSDPEQLLVALRPQKAKL